MEVKTGELKNNLSRYLKRLAETGEAITILDRNRPVARILPMRGNRGSKKSAWSVERAKMLERASKLGIQLTIPEIQPKPMRDLKFKPEVAPDGRVDIDTVVSMRREKDY